VVIRNENRAIEMSLALLLVVALLAGGGPRGVGDFIVHLATLPCIVALALCPAEGGQLPRAWKFFWAAALALPVFQLVPLPVGVWGHLPGRASVLRDLQSAGVTPSWMPFSLDPWGTMRASIAVVPPAVACIAAARLDGLARRRVLTAVLATATVIALLGFSQAAAGAYSALRFYDFHHPIGAIGTFANRNHFAALLGMLVPVAIGLAADARERRLSGAGVVWAAVALVLFLAAALSFSRAGFALCVLATLAALALQIAAGKGRWQAPLFIAAVAGIGVAVYAWDGLSQRLAQDPLDDLRWQYLRYAPEAAAQYFPWGSGLGSFKWVYAAAEPVEVMRSVYAGHAHNDVLQLAIEAGVAGLLLVIALVLLMVRDGLRIFPLGKSRGSGDHGVPRVIGIAVWVPVLHSLVDYPLRTLAVATVFGAFLAWQHAPRRTSD